MATQQLPHLDARLAAVAEYVRPGNPAADIGCDHGKLAAWLAGSGRCPRVIAADLRPGPLAKARLACAPYGDAVDCRLGDGLAVLQPGEVQDIVIAGMGAETIADILAAEPWVRDETLNFVLVPSTKHSLMRRWLARNGFALQAETLAFAAGRYYAVMNARYTGKVFEPDGLWCLCGKLQGQPGAEEYRRQQCGKLKKYRRGLAERCGEALAVDALIAQLEGTQWP